MSAGDGASGEVVIPDPSDQEELRREIEGALAEAVLPEKREDTTERVMRIVTAETYRGALPHPRHFAQFEQILPGAAERIFTMTEKEQAHRHQCDRDIINAQKTYGTRGQYLGASLIVLPLAAAFYCAITGRTLAAGLFLAPPIITGAVAFVRGQLSFLSDNGDTASGT